MSESKENYKRINILVTNAQYRKVNDLGLNMSGLVRGLLEDHFSDEKIVFSVSPAAKKLYQTVISNLGGEDRGLEPYFIKALDSYLAAKAQEIEALRKSITDQPTNVEPT